MGAFLSEMDMYSTQRAKNSIVSANGFPWPRVRSSIFCMFDGQPGEMIKFIQVGLGGIR